MISIVRASPDLAAGAAAEPPGAGVLAVGVVAAGDVGAVVAVEAAAVAELDGAEDGVGLEAAGSFLPHPATRSAAKSEMESSRIFMAVTTL